MPRMTSAGVQWTPMLNHTPIPHLQRLKELGDHTDPSHFWNRLYDSNKDAPLSVFTCTPRSVPVSAVRGRRVSVPGAVVTRAKARKARLERKNNRNENKDAKEEDDNDAVTQWAGVNTTTLIYRLQDLISKRVHLQPATCKTTISSMSQRRCSGHLFSMLVTVKKYPLVKFHQRTWAWTILVRWGTVPY
mmetsp:Transcript_11326/g.18557  ORF Transcript_11326/g.18557 Transcript_11326/m.18557 type:complete len:189 (+) Transcript_11326:7408-7974(+)